MLCPIDPISFLLQSIDPPLGDRSAPSRRTGRRTRCVQAGLFACTSEIFERLDDEGQPALGARLEASGRDGAGSGLEFFQRLRDLGFLFAWDACLFNSIARMQGCKCITLLIALALLYIVAGCSLKEEHTNSWNPPGPHPVRTPGFRSTNVPRLKALAKAQVRFDETVGWSG